jgi:hypothetical protein
VPLLLACRTCSRTISEHAAAASSHGQHHLVLYMPSHASCAAVADVAVPLQTCMVELMTQVSCAGHSLCPLLAFCCSVASALERTSQHACLLEFLYMQDPAKTNPLPLPLVLQRCRSLLPCWNARTYSCADHGLPACSWSTCPLRASCL